MDRTAGKFVQVLGLGITIDERSGGRRRAASVDEELNGCRGFYGATALLVLSAQRSAPDGGVGASDVSAHVRSA